MEYVERLLLDIEYYFYEVIRIYSDLFYKAQSGLRIEMVTQVVIALLVIRFVIDILTKNIKTALIILCICCATVFMWNKYLYLTIRALHDNWEFAPYFIKWRYEATTGEVIDKAKSKWYYRRDKLGVVDWRNPHMIIVYTLRSMFKRFAEDGREFRVDPISMWVSAQKLPLNDKLVFEYYKWYNIYMPSASKAFRTVWLQTRNFCQFTLLTRVGKGYIPYFFRWHFTFEMIYEQTAKIFIEMAVRAIWFWQEGCWNRAAELVWMEACNEAKMEPEAFREILDVDRSHKNRIMNMPIFKMFRIPIKDAIFNWYYETHPRSIYDDIVLDAKCCILLNRIIMYIHMFILLTCMFNAALGQYMYVPFIVENVERHVEYRPVRTKYSTGCAAWQKIPLSVRARRFPPQLWWGWFSRGTDKGNIFLYIPMQIFKFILRRLRNFLRKLKRKI